MVRKLLLMGANNPETLRIIDAMNASGSGYRIVGWLDNDANKFNTDFLGFKVLGSPERLLDEEYRECYVFNNITRNGATRKAVTEQLQRYTDKFANVIHPSVNLLNVKVGEGVCIQEGALVQSHAELGDHCFVTAASLIGHEAIIGVNSFIAGGCVVAGLVSIGEGATLWTGSIVAPRLRIGDGAVVGINSSVLEDVPDNTTVFGNPARKIFQKKS